MEVKRVSVPEQTFTQFCDQHSLTVIIQERGKDRLSGAEKYYVTLRPDPEIPHNGMLRSVCGNGDTEHKAILDLIRQISEQPLVFDAYKDTRKEIQAPRILRKA